MLIFINNKYGSSFAILLVIVGIATLGYLSIIEKMKEKKPGVSRNILALRRQHLVLEKGTSNGEITNFEI